MNLTRTILNFCESKLLELDESAKEAMNVIDKMYFQCVYIMLIASLIHLLLGFPEVQHFVEVQQNLFSYEF